ncbi:urease subunit gamma [Streptomyces sp. NPDC059506]|uniref:urease subunit gamma n=1 Tax=Streptomyces TaxID=1883 RepID=UPI000CB701A7|nr:MULTISPECIES: urease subunit gamma [unclassified Streptomyces]MCZ2525899.1 urease subunit gamma [Streptomyces sp. HB2AG]PLW71365.1 urea amidohydrolase [Streptomyces sp. DJ]QMV24648.1 urea amidohydrolase [Streptomyces sp. SCUT-3]
MHLTPREQERLTLFSAAGLARRRLARGALLGATEAVALVCDEILEAAWDGTPLEAVVELARDVVPRERLLPGVAEAVPAIQVEALFPHGSSLVHVDEPFGPADPAGPGGVLVAEGDVELAPGRPRTELRVVNRGRRPVWVSSHFPLEEANAVLEFDRAAARGHRLDVPAGTSVRFDPDEPRTVTAVARGGER